MDRAAPGNIVDWTFRNMQHWCWMVGVGDSTMKSVFPSSIGKDLECYWPCFVTTVIKCNQMSSNTITCHEYFSAKSIVPRQLVELRAICSLFDQIFTFYLKNVQRISSLSLSPWLDRRLKELKDAMHQHPIPRWAAVIIQTKQNGMEFTGRLPKFAYFKTDRENSTRWSRTKQWSSKM